jgi:phosphate-selective porin
MNKFRRISAMVAATVAATGMAMTATTAPAAASAKPKGPVAVSSVLKTQNEKSGHWQKVWFKTDVKACNFKLHVYDMPGVEISYPWDWSYTSLHGDATLKKNETDYASFHVEAGSVKKDTLRYLPASITFDNCKKGDAKMVTTKWTAFVLPVRNV